MDDPTSKSGPDKRVPPSFSPRRNTMDDRTLNGGRDKHVPPKGRRGTLVVPDEMKWITHGGKADLTSGSLRACRGNSLIAPTV